MAKRRDMGLDVLKGLACVMMLFAHVWATGGAWVHDLRYIGAFAPVLFYGVTGVTTEFQLKKRRPGGLILAYAALATLGFLNTWIWHPHTWVADIMQCIGLSVIALILLRRVLAPGAFAFLFPLPFLVHWALQAAQVSLPFPLAPFLVTPGIFALAPWLSFFLLGHWAYHAPLRQTAGLAGVAVTAAAGARAFGLDMGHKFAMPPGYFALSCALLLVAMVAVRACPAVLSRLDAGHAWVRAALRSAARTAQGALIYFGRYSLLFLFAHLFAGKVLLAPLRLSADPLLLWGLALVATWAVMAGVLRLHETWLAKLELGENGLFWAALMAAGIVLTYSGATVWLYPLGFLFATHYLALVRRLGAKSAGRAQAALVRPTA